MQFLQKVIFLIIIVATGREGLSQWRHDAHFVMGYWSGDLAKDPVLQFGSDSVSISYQRLALGFTVASANMSNKDGKLLFYFNESDDILIVEMANLFSVVFVKNEFPCF